MLPLNRISVFAAIMLAICSSVYCATEAQEKDQEYVLRDTLRKELGIYKFVSSDFPAMFAIIAGISIILVFAVIYIAVGLLSMEPAKDSIIYRMTTTRQKRD